MGQGEIVDGKYNTLRVSAKPARIQFKVFLEVEKGVQALQL
jgi:hypothetical protein